MTAKGYWIGRVDVADEARYMDYVRANAEAFARFGARFLVRGGPSKRPEGAARSRNVVIEFPSLRGRARLLRQPRIPGRQGACATGRSTGDIVIIEGYDGPQPGD